MSVFHPDPTCFEPSNLWVTTGYCQSYIPPFSTKPADYKSSLRCPTVMLGPLLNSNNDDSSCYQSNAYARPPQTAVYTACPEGMTSAGEASYYGGEGMTTAATYCCPTAYDFTFNTHPTKPAPLPTVIDGETYTVLINTGYMCKATSVETLVEKTVTLTVTTSPELLTTESAWDYETGLILAKPAGLTNFVYEGVGTTSTCVGGYSAGCNAISNPLAPPTATPTITSAPEGTYVPPPSHPLTRFTPAPSCLSESNLWFVSTSCYLTGADFSPAWLSCTMTEFGEPDVSNSACYGSIYAASTLGPDGTASFFATCPVGYTTAMTSTSRPFDEPKYSSSKTQSFDAVVTHVNCCPSGPGYDFKYTEIRQTRTAHDGVDYNVQLYIMPGCVASHVKTLSDKEVTMGLFSDPRVWDKRDEETPRTTTRWDYEHNTIWAQEKPHRYTVFHGTYTCFEKCTEYFTYSYHNTDPNAPTTTSSSRIIKESTTPNGTGGTGGSGDKNGAAAMKLSGLWVLTAATLAYLAVA